MSDRFAKITAEDLDDDRIYELTIGARLSLREAEAWCVQRGTGRITVRLLRRLLDVDLQEAVEWAKELTVQGFWREVDDHYELVGFTEKYAFTDPEAMADRGRTGGFMKAHNEGRHEVAVEGCPACADAGTPSTASSATSRPGTASPASSTASPATSRPGQTETETETETTTVADAPDSSSGVVEALRSEVPGLIDPDEGIPGDFREFFELYVKGTRRTGSRSGSRAAALKTWKSMKVRDRIAAMTGLTSQMERITARSSMPHAVTWLNQKRWIDDAFQERPDYGTPRGAPQRVQENRDTIAKALGVSDVIDVDEVGP